MWQNLIYFLGLLQPSIENAGILSKDYVLSGVYGGLISHFTFYQASLRDQLGYQFSFQICIFWMKYVVFSFSAHAFPSLLRKSNLDGSQQVQEVFKKALIEKD